ncbi:thioesterase family protein [Rhodococcus sp. HNM0569]|uniref:thioesterase family protein n=1 Tax=Rhodococcus sp. HNM0569 TaxID=2716340 RepID=UPI00146B9A9D|nr:thioesterase family protein [Rhodococcus sp. HNM0569]NLU84908.1 thioesterase family protein [Rhodococcus sp. HNM0569]
MTSHVAYYVPLPAPTRQAPPGAHGDGERFASTPATVSVWADTMQHGAPPSALLVRALERHDARPDTRLTRVVVEILGAVPVAELDVHCRTVRPGKQIELLTAELWTVGDDPRPVARAHGWRMATLDTSAVARTVDAPLAPGSAGAPTDMWPSWGSGYLDTLDWSWVTAPGGTEPGRVWARPTPALVEGEEPTALERLFCVADVSNGIGAKLDPAHWTFMNTDLTVHVHRIPTGEWVGVSADTSVGPDGVGMCAGVLYDEAGAVGRITQTVLVRPR